MIYTEDSISEVTKNAIRMACEDVVTKKIKQRRVFNICMWTLVFIMVITSSVLSIIGRDVGWVWGWPVLLMVIIVNSNRQYEYEADVMKISINSDIMNKIKNGGA
jgi:hypothetical protein